MMDIRKRIKRNHPKIHRALTLPRKVSVSPSSDCPLVHTESEKISAYLDNSYFVEEQPSAREADELVVVSAIACCAPVSANLWAQSLFVPPLKEVHLHDPVG